MEDIVSHNGRILELSAIDIVARNTEPDEIVYHDRKSYFPEETEEGFITLGFTGFFFSVDQILVYRVVLYTKNLLGVSTVFNQF